MCEPGSLQPPRPSCLACFLLGDVVLCLVLLWPVGSPWLCFVLLVALCWWLSVLSPVWGTQG